ncbi:secretory calcium-binding phosphoprotein 1 [Pungitius pungitius]|uniref:secretory calcium-binding phosphoprotein 1 n=1 Tax=Pungitius pungitius TaxID=134920 RepID=UPI0018899E75|nr:secretory calcium-binding phosphoprotein 1 [Pungitius pungitius]
MMVNIIMFCLMGAVFANPISFNAVLESNELDSNSTESLSVLQSSQNGTSELLSSEESSSNQSQSSESSSESESTSTESTSEDKTEEESNSLLDEKDVADSMAETTDNSMGSEENIRKSWVQAFATVIRVQSAEDNSSTEVKGQSEQLTKKLANNSTTIRQGADTQLPLVETPADSSDTTSDSANTSEGATASTSDSSESSSSESNETSETSDSSDSRDTNASVEESNASDNALLGQLETKDCVNGTQSCESEEYLFQDIGDDAHYSVDSLMVPDDDERELSLRR